MQSRIIDDEIEALKNKLNELEKAKEAKEIYNNKNDINKNFDILNNSINNRIKSVKEDSYSKSCIVAKFIDKDMIDPLQAIFNILSILNDKLNKLENDENTKKSSN